jgi:hypothetical protein
MHLISQTLLFGFSSRLLCHHTSLINCSCHELENVEDVRGKAVFMRRGRCTFVDKLESALAAGAIAVVFGNSANTPIAAPGSLPEQQHTNDPEFSSATVLPSLSVGYDAGKGE